MKFVQMSETIDMSNETYGADAVAAIAANKKSGYITFAIIEQINAIKNAMKKGKRFVPLNKDLTNVERQTLCHFGYTIKDSLHLYEANIIGPEGLNWDDHIGVHAKTWHKYFN